MIFDTHCHYNLDPLFSDGWEEISTEEMMSMMNSGKIPPQLIQRDGQWMQPKMRWQEHWQKAQAEGVKHSVVVGTSFQTSSIAASIAEQEKNLFAAIGVHPNEYADEASIHNLKEDGFESSLNDVLTDIEEISIIGGPKVVAIGETGLDYFHLNRNGEISPETKTQVIALQKSAFTRHIHLAQEKNLPLIIHVRDTGEQAYWDVIDILKKEKYSGKFILHCVSGPMEYVQEAIKLGGYIGVAGNVTYKNAEHIRTLVKSVPMDRILLETDAPFLPPQEFRGKVCEPWMIAKTADFLENELGMSKLEIFLSSINFFSLN